MQTVNAIFYDFKYYILPEGCDFKDIKDGDVISAKRLKEEECMAPDFVYESIEDESVEIAVKAFAFPVTANLYTKKEYNALLLKQIKRVCPGCLRYNDDGDDEHLDGHHREISLKGVCYEREEEGEPSYSTRVMWFYYELADILDELAECVDTGNAVKFNRLCEKASRCILQPVKFFGEKRDGKYILYMQCANHSDLYFTMLAYTALSSHYGENPLAKAGWAVIPFIPEGAGGYKGKTKGDKPVARIERSDLEWKYDLIVSVEKGLTEKQTDKLVDDIYRYIAFKIGEDRLLRVLNTVGADDEPPVMTADEICEKFREADEELPDKFPPAIPYGWENIETAAPYKSTVDGLTSCISLSDLASEPSLAEEIRFGSGYAYAYLYVPVTPDKKDEIYDTLYFYLCREDAVPEPLLIKEDFNYSFYIIGVSNCMSGVGEGIAFDFFVADEKMFYRFLKILAPVLKAYGAKLAVINESGVNEYVCGEDIVPANGGESN